MKKSLFILGAVAALFLVLLLPRLKVQLVTAPEPVASKAEEAPSPVAEPAPQPVARQEAPATNQVQHPFPIRTYTPQEAAYMRQVNATRFLNSNVKDTKAARDVLNILATNGIGLEHYETAYRAAWKAYMASPEERLARGTNDYTMRKDYFLSPDDPRRLEEFQRLYDQHKQRLARDLTENNRIPEPVAKLLVEVPAKKEYGFADKSAATYRFKDTTEATLKQYLQEHPNPSQP